MIEHQNFLLKRAFLCSLFSHGCRLIHLAFEVPYFTVVFQELVKKEETENATLIQSLAEPIKITFWLIYFFYIAL